MSLAFMIDWRVGVTYIVNFGHGGVDDDDSFVGVCHLLNAQLADVLADGAELVAESLEQFVNKGLMVIALKLEHMLEFQYDNFFGMGLQERVQEGKDGVYGVTEQGMHCLKLKRRRWKIDRCAICGQKLFAPLPAFDVRQPSRESLECVPFLH